jgi:hypothetical protein
MELTLLGKRGDEIDGSLALSPILTDFAAHGAFALFVPASAAGDNQADARMAM